jgi:molecular chaperone HscB
MTFTLCWSCKSPPQGDSGGTAFFCLACGAVQPPDAYASLFAALNLPEAFILDRAVLEAAYLAAQQRLHPDRLQGHSPREQLFAEQHAMQLNAAYTTLRDPLRRGRHLLTLRGVPDASGETVQDAEILLESLSDREALADADSPEAVADLGANVRQRQQASEARVAAAFAADDLARAARELLRLGYLCKFSDMIRDRQRQSLHSI